MLYPLNPAYSILPRLRFMAPKPEDPKGGGGADPKPTEPKNFVDPSGKEWNFPADTKVEDMTADQTAEYWKEKAKKHEKNRKPDDFDQIQADALAFRQKQEKEKPEQEQAVNTARTEGRLDGLKATLPTVLALAIKSKNSDIEDDDVEDIIDDLDLAKFIKTDGTIDTDRVNKLADKHADTAGDANDRQLGDPLASALGHNKQPRSGAPAAGGSVTALQEEARNRMQPRKG